VLGLAHAVLPGARLRQAVRVACFDVSQLEIKDLPSASTLVGLGRAFGYTKPDEEADANYARRVFGVGATRE